MKRWVVVSFAIVLAGLALAHLLRGGDAGAAAAAAARQVYEQSLLGDPDPAKRYAGCMVLGTSEYQRVLFASAVAGLTDVPDQAPDAGRGASILGSGYASLASGCAGRHEAAARVAYGDALDRALDEAFVELLERDPNVVRLVGVFAARRQGEAPARQATALR